eukprot:scaffold493373_cov18-Prasinocladus_malaysianus.AAC.1
MADANEVKCLAHEDRSRHQKAGAKSQRAMTVRWAQRYYAVNLAIAPRNELNQDENNDQNKGFPLHSVSGGQYTTGKPKGIESCHTNASILLANNIAALLHSLMMWPTPKWTQDLTTCLHVDGLLVTYGERTGNLARSSSYRTELSAVKNVCEK